MRSLYFYTILLTSTFLLLMSCRQEPHFVIKGVVNQADKQTLYLEQVGLSSLILLDSVQLKSSGKFSFKQPHTASPDFYRLRLGKNAINVAIDSTEHVTITGSAHNFGKEYTVEGSPNNLNIQQLTQLQWKAQKAYQQLQVQKESLDATAYHQALLQIAENYKKEAGDYIFSAPWSSAAYFALFQQVDGLLMYDPYNKDDNKLYAMVATSWDARYPDSDRAKHLHALTLRGMKIIRGTAANRFDKVPVQDALSYFEVSLPNVKGQILSLSQLIAEQKVILLDFTLYQSNFSSVRNMALADLYTKYQAQGLEIYQISLDTDLNYWQNVAINLPWICVRDPQSMYSSVAATYNVMELPTTFILNRQGEIVDRLTEKEMELAIKKLL